MTKFRGKFQFQKINSKIRRTIYYYQLIGNLMLILILQKLRISIGPQIILVYHCNYRLGLQ
jgi:hypothetical protein